MKIDRIYIATHKGDLRFTRICVASIRYYYPEIPIFLLVDYLNGPCDTTEIEKKWNVHIYQIEKKKFGWGFAKLEPYFDPVEHRFLIIDSDVLFIGKVIENLERFDEDFIVQEETQSEKDIHRLYFNIKKIRQVDPKFEFLGFTFNSGQIVGTSGLLKRTDFELVMDSSDPPKLKFPEIFMPGDQGILNYVIHKKLSQKKISVARCPFMIWPGHKEIHNIFLKEIRQKKYHNLIHWAGMKKQFVHKMVRSDIVDMFENYYYSKIQLSRFIKQYRNSVDNIRYLSKKIMLKSKRLLSN